MSIDPRLLAVIGRRLPAVYDVIPRGPLGRYAEVALNPQPLPPLEFGSALAAEFARAVWLAERAGLDLEAAFSDLDDWCPTVPRRPKLPPWWPPVPDPEPHPDWFTAFHLGFAARLAVTSAEYEGTSLAESLNRAVERSVATLESAG